MAKKTAIGYFRQILLSIIALIVFSLCFTPIVVFGYLLLKYFSFTTFSHYLLVPVFLYIGTLLLFVSTLLISGIFIKIFRIRYKTGIYEYTFNNKNTFRWIIICTLYTPCRWILETFPLGGLRNTYLRLLGMKIGKNTLVGGVIKDPCVTEFGDNVTMGEYAIIYGHIHNFEKALIDIRKVVIGSNCVIGAGSIIMPGAKLEDSVTLAAGAVVAGNQILKKGKTYAGIPAREIKKQKK